MPHKIFEAEAKGVGQEFTIKDLKALSSKKGVTRVDTVALEEFMAMEKKPKLYSATISTIRTDRGKDAMIPQGVLTEAFVKSSPLQIYHKGEMVPIGKILTLIIYKDHIDMVFHFDEKEENDPVPRLSHEIQRAYDKGLMRAFSIGFLYKAIMWRDDLMDTDGTIKEAIDIDLPGGETLKKFKVADFGELPWLIATAWELLEVSTVNIGMNSEALLKNAKDGLSLIKRKTLDTVEVGYKSFVDNEFSEDSAALEQAIAEFETKWCSEDLKPSPIVRKHSVPLAKSEEWEKEEAVAQLLGWASEDGSGDKEKVDWPKFAKGFLHYNPEKTDSISAYSLCHHTVEDGDLVVSKQGLVDSMLELKESDLEKEVKEKAFGHLFKHFEDLGVDISLFENSENIAFAQIFSEKDVEVDEDSSDTGPKTGEIEAKLAKIDEILSRFEDLDSLIKDGLIGIRCKINVLTQRFDDYASGKDISLDLEVNPGEDVDEEEYSTLLKSLQGFGSSDGQ